MKPALRALLTCSLLALATLAHAADFAIPAKQLDISGVKYLKGSKRVLVLGVNLEVMNWGKISSVTQTSALQTLGGASNSSTRSTLEIAVPSDVAALRAVADELYADLTAKLTAAGWEVIPFEKVAGTATILGAKTEPVDAKLGAPTRKVNLGKQKMSYTIATPAGMLPFNWGMTMPFWTIRSVLKEQDANALELLCTTNMILHGIDTPTNIRHGNTLARPYKDYTDRDRVHVIITNPPFGGTEEDGIENNFPATFRTRETADLFMALIIKLLKNHGRAAVVLPDGFLFGEGMKTRLKQDLVEKCNLHTIVRLPNGVFAPYTGIKTNILFFTKKPESEQPATSHIWFYEHPYPEGVTSYNKTKPMRFEEFQPEIDWWGDESDGFKARVENQQAWRVSIDQIQAANYNLDLKNPHAVEESHGDVAHLLPEYEKLLGQIADTRARLKNELQRALTATAGSAE